MRPPLDGSCRSWSTSASRPGRDVGEALAHLMELRLEGGPMDEDEAYEALEAWARERGLIDSRAGRPGSASKTSSPRRPVG